jgi:hypothetical protein
VQRFFGNPSRILAEVWPASTSNEVNVSNRILHQVSRSMKWYYPIHIKIGILGPCSYTPGARNVPSRADVRVATSHSCFTDFLKHECSGPRIHLRHVFQNITTVVCDYRVLIFCCRTRFPERCLSVSYAYSSRSCQQIITNQEPWFFRSLCFLFILEVNYPTQQSRHHSQIAATRICLETPLITGIHSPKSDFCLRKSNDHRWLGATKFFPSAARQLSISLMLTRRTTPRLHWIRLQQQYPRGCDGNCPPCRDPDLRP